MTYARHWSQKTKTKKGKITTVGGQAWAKKMAKLRRGKKA